MYGVTYKIEAYILLLSSLVWFFFFVYSEWLSSCTGFLFSLSFMILTVTLWKVGKSFQDPSPPDLDRIALEWPDLPNYRYLCLFRVYLNKKKVQVFLYICVIMDIYAFCAIK